MPKRLNQVQQFYTDGLGVTPWGGPGGNASLNSAYSNLTSSTPAVAADEGAKGNITNSGDRNERHTTGVFYTTMVGTDWTKSLRASNTDI